MNSIWTETLSLPKFDSLKGDIKTDVLVIGGGMAGILTAYFLKKEGVDCILVEADRICSGVTKNTTAKITVQHGLIYDDLIRKFGREKAQLYLASQIEALNKYKTLCSNFDCDYEEKSSFVYSKSSLKKLEREVKALNSLGYNAEFVSNIPIPIWTVGAVKINSQAQFHPLKFIETIVKDLSIYENTRVMDLESTGAITENGRIHCQKVIVATHFPFINKHGAYFLKMYQHRSYVIALKNACDVGGMYVDEADNGMSFRNHNGFLLIGGGDHRTGKTGGGWWELSEFARLHYPKAEIAYRWATQDCMTLDKRAYIGLYSKATPNLYIATGFNKWGMTSSMVSAMILKDLVQGRSNVYSSIYNPSRSILHPQLAVNAFESICGLLTPTVPRCPHLGCALKYNAQEHTWDCSCHGSRFEENGDIIDNPATQNANIKK